MIMELKRRRSVGLGSLGDTCQIPQPGVEMVFPACSGSFTGVPTPLSPAAFVQPTLVGAPACASQPGSMFTSECIKQVLGNQQADLSANMAANRDVFLQDCQNNWTVNAERFRELGLPVPPNDCQSRSFGQTTNITPAFQDPLAPVHFTTLDDVVAISNSHLNLTPATPSQTQQVSVISQAVTPPASSTGLLASLTKSVDLSSLVSSLPTAIQGDVSVGGFEFPVWGLVAAGVGLFFVMGRH